MSKLSFTAAGDAIIFRHLPEGYPGLSGLRNYIMKGDFRFVNLETTVHNFESYGAAVSGGGWLCARPFVLDELKKFGFNVTSSANNHALDYCHKGFVKTLEYVEAAGIPNCGVGRNLAEAAAPVYLDTPNGRIAVISACSTFDRTAMAGAQTSIMQGRPGVNGIRVNTTHILPREQLDQLTQIGKSLGINAVKELARREGYQKPLPDNMGEMGVYLFQEGEKPGIRTTVNENDMKRVENSIREALYFADSVVVCFHSHEFRDGDKEKPAQFAEQFSRRCIDAGASAVVGTGPHLLRPIEIYKGCPIFYCIGDFILQLETMERVPSEMFEGQQLSPDAGMDVLYDTRSDCGKHGLYYLPKMFEAVVPYWQTENGRLTKLELMPVELHFGEKRSTGGWPEIKTDAGIIERLAEMSRSFGTEIKVKNGVGSVEL